MSDCRRTLERLAPYADGELPAGDRTEVEQHLSACGPCRAAAAADACARRVVRHRAAFLRSQPLPPALRARCEALARTRAGRPIWQRLAPPSWLRGAAMRLVPVPLTALMVLITGLLVFSFATHRSDTLLAAQLTADHAKCFRLFAEDDAAAADAHQLERMLAEQYGWELHVPPSSPQEGVQLIGARRCLYADGRVPHVMYRVDGRDVSLYMLEGVSRRAAEVESLGHRSHVWSRGDRTFVLVSAADADLSRAAAYVMQEAH